MMGNRADTSTITTKHFVFTKLTAADGDRYFALSNNDNVMKYVTGFGLNRDESDAMLRDLVAENNNDTFCGRYLVEDRRTGALIGIGRIDRNEEDIEVGYRLNEEFWGKGYATEICRELIHFSMKAFRPAAVVAFVNIENLASIRVLEKSGMQCVETIEDIDQVKYKFVYSLQNRRNMKKVLYVVIGLIALVLVAGLIMPKDFAVEKEIVINKPRSEVYNYLEALSNQNNWSVWSKRDPNMKTTYKGTDRTVGFTYMWEGNDEVGKGEQEIKKLEKDVRIDSELRFIKPFESKSDAYLITEDAGPGQTKVKWGFTGTMPFPMNAFLPFMGMDNSVGKDFADGLANLKAILEK